MDTLTGKTIDRYQIMEILGEGGMATVYRARDTRLDMDVALKIIRTDNLPPNLVDVTLKRFEREAKALARLTHPNIVKVTDFGEFDGKPYIVMAYLAGGTLGDLLKKGPLEWGSAFRLMLPVCRALEYAHKENLIHRDIKPANILLTPGGEPMLSDFGLAKILGGNSGATLTGTGVGLGTPEYMAPEQWTGDSVPQSDIYSMGVVLYEAITGSKPYIADTPASLFLKQAKEPPRNPRELIPDLPREVDQILSRALAKRAEDRFPTVSAFCAAIEEILDPRATHIRKKTAKESEDVAEFETVIQKGASVLPRSPDIQVETQPLDRQELSVDSQRLLSNKRSTSIWGGLIIAALIAIFVCVCVGFFLLQANTLDANINPPTGSPSLTVATALTRTVKSSPSATQQMESPILPLIQPTLEPDPTQAPCNSPSIVFRSTAKGRFLDICSPQSGEYEIGPIAEGDYAIGPNDVFFVYCDINGVVYASRFGDKTLVTMEDSVKDFSIIRGKSDTPSFTMTFTLDSIYKVIIEENKSGEKRAISIPRYITNP